MFIIVYHVNVELHFYINIDSGLNELLSFLLPEKKLEVVNQ